MTRRVNEADAHSFEEIDVAVDAGPKQSVYDDAVMTDEGPSEAETVL